MLPRLNRLLCVGLVSLAIPALAAAAAKPLKLDMVHSKIGFTASTLLFDVDGRFKKFAIELDGDPGKPAAAKLRVSIDAASIDTGNGKRDEHLRNPDFFDVKAFPKITFESTRIEQTARGLKVAGKLTMHGKTKAVTIPFKRASGKNGAGQMTDAYKGKITINRNDWGVGAGSVAAKISLDEEVALQLVIVTLR